MDPIPLAPEDRAILDLECETIAGHTCKVIRLGGEGAELEDLRARVAERVAAAPALATRLGGTADEPAWVPWEGFDPAARIRPLEVDEPIARADLPEHVSRLFEQRLDRERPLWQIHVAPLADGGTALIWRIHHALADGTASMRLARALLWDEAEDGAGPVPPAEAHETDDARRRRHLAAFVDREFGEALHRSPFDGRIGTRRQIAFASVDMRGLHDAAKAAAGATLNDAVLSVVAGSLRQWLQEHHGTLGALRVRVPVSLHHEGDAAANRDSFFSLALPLNVADPLERLRLVHAATAKRKAAHDAELMDSMMRELGTVSPRMRTFCQRIEASPRSFALSVSNVPGPRAPVSVLGSPVESVHSIAEIGRRHALRISALSLAGDLHFGLCADPGLVEGLDVMAAGIETEAAALVALA
jgi:diacylglycerol O-acyltransferase